MRNVNNFLARHAWAIFFACAVGLLSGIPQYLAVTAIGPAYHGIPFLFQDNEPVYLTRIHEFVDGNTTVSSPFLHEYKNSGASVMPPVGEAGYYLTSVITHISLTNIVIASKYLLPAVLFLLLYAFTLVLLSGSVRDQRLAALTAATLGTLGYSLIHPGEALSVLRGTYSEVYLSLWTRLVHPISGALLLFGYLISLRLATPRRYWFAIAATVLLSFSTGYIYAFGIGMSLVGILIVIALCKRDIHQAMIYGSVVVGALLINVPHFLSIAHQVGGSSLAEGLKGGLLLTHQPLMSASLWAALVVVAGVYAYMWWQGRKLSLEDPLVWVLAALAACIIGMNQQIITGKTVWPQHFIQYGIPLIYIAAVVAYAECTSPRLQRYKNLVFIALIAVSFAVTLASLSTYHFALKDFTTVNRYAAAMQYVDQTPGPCVVFPVEENEHLNPYVTAFTHCDTYYTHYVFMGVPPERIMDNMLAYLYFMNVTPATVDTFLASHEDKVWAVFFRDWRDIFFKTKDPWLTSISNQADMNAWLASTTADIATHYRTFYSGDVHAELLKHELDYVVWDSQGSTPFSPSHFPFLTQVYESDGIVVYRVK